MFYLYFYLNVEGWLVIIFILTKKLFFNISNKSFGELFFVSGIYKDINVTALTNCTIIFI